jgi:hypothetical protein
MLALRYFLLLSVFPACALIGLVLDWRLGLGITVAVVLLLAWQAYRLGSSFGGIMANFGRAYRSVPRLLWTRDVRAAQRACGPGVQPVIACLDGTHFFGDLPPLEARELQVVVRETRQGLRELFPGSQPVDRVLLFSQQRAMLDYVGGWFGAVGSKAAGFCFALGPVRVVGAVDAFRELGRDPKALLAHELVHGGVRGAARGLAMFPWLNEGLAEALAVSWFEPARVPGLHRFLRRARAAGHWLDWGELSAARPGHVVAWLRSGDRDQLMKAQLLYSQSCLLVMALLDREGPEHPCLRAMMRKPAEAESILRRHLGFDAAELLARVGREVDVASLELTPWDRNRRTVLRGLLAQDPPSRFQASAVLGLAACGDDEDLPLLEGLAADENLDLATLAGLALDLLRGAP